MVRNALILGLVGAAVFGGVSRSAHAQFSVWTGGGGANRNWSNPANWAGGVPTSVSNGLIAFVPPDFNTNLGITQNDLNLEIGTLELVVPPYNVAFTGNAIRLGTELKMGKSFYATGTFIATGDLKMTSSITPTLTLPVQEVASVASLTGAGLTTFTGAWRIDNLALTGDVRIPAGGSLSASSLQTHSWKSLVVEGIFGVPGTVKLPAGVAADLRDGVLDLGRNDNTLGGPATDRVKFESDVLLGEWLIRGQPYGGTNDRLDATGTLDLTQSHVTGFGITFETLQPGTTYLTLASYGNRIGALDVSSIHVSSLLGGTFPAGLYPIVYTSAENAGPGEIRVLVPEPASLVALIIGSSVVGRRRR